MERRVSSEEFTKSTVRAIEFYASSQQRLEVRINAGRNIYFAERGTFSFALEFSRDREPYARSHRCDNLVTSTETFSTAVGLAMASIRAGHQRAELANSFSDVESRGIVRARLRIGGNSLGERFSLRPGKKNSASETHSEGPCSEWVHAAVTFYRTIFSPR